MIKGDRRLARALALALLFAVALCLPARANEGGAKLKAQEILRQRGYFEGAATEQKFEQALERLAAHAQAFGMELKGDALMDALVASEIPAQGDTASPGDTSETVMRIQRKLRTLRFLADKADGRYGANTERAVAVFQESAGREPTGVADVKTQEALFDASARAAQYPVLQRGEKGEPVTSLQQQLALLGFYTGLSDGHYGEDTVVGVKAFESYVRTSGQYESLDAHLRESDMKGLADPLIQKLLYSGDFVLAPNALKPEDSGQQVYRLQRRLIALTYLAGEPDGGFGEKTGQAVKAFQKRNRLKVTGEADIATQEALYSGGAVAAIKPYRLKVSLSEKRLYVYQSDEQGGYGELRNTMRCAIGPLAKAGEYEALTTPSRSEWTQAGGHAVRYPYSLDGQVIIHSIPYDKKNGAPVATFLNMLGQDIDFGGIMVSAEDAKLIYEKCPRYTKVEIIG